MQETHNEVSAKRASEKAKSRRVFGQARKPAKVFRAGIYARVSTNDQQTIPLQIRALREYAVRRGWTIALQVKEVGSGASQRQLREAMLEAVRRREIDVVLVWRLDRWGRSVADLLNRSNVRRSKTAVFVARFVSGSNSSSDSRSG